VVQRFTVIALLVAACGLTGCAWLGIGGSDKKPVPLAPLTTNDASVLWSASVAKARGSLFVPAVGDRIVYAAGRDGSIYALSEEGGRIVTKLDAKTAIAGGVGAGDDMVIVGGTKGDVIALDSAGRLLWKTSVAGDLLAAPVIASGNVIVRTADGRLMALNRIDGKRKWVFQRSAPALTLRTNASVVVNRGVIYAGYPGGKVIAIELEAGKPIWEAAISLPRGSTELERIADVAGLPVLDDTRICAAVYQGRTGCVETLNGNVLWSREVSSADGVAIDAKYLYVADVEGNVFGLDKTSGTTVWKQEKLQRRDPGTPSLIKGKVVIGDKEGFVHVLSAENGDLTGRIPTDGSRVVSLVRNGDRAIAQTEKGGVFAIAIR
jgi:outer membrane protein assembly factor BamB